MAAASDHSCAQRLTLGPSGVVVPADSQPAGCRRSPPAPRRHGRRRRAGRGLAPARAPARPGRRAARRRSGRRALLLRRAERGRAGPRGRALRGARAPDGVRRGHDLRPVPQHQLPPRALALAGRGAPLPAPGLPSRLALRHAGHGLRGGGRGRAALRLHLRRLRLPQLGRGAIAPGTALPGVSGFRVTTPLNRPDIFDELVVFQGASYFRALGRGNAYG